MPDKPPKAEPVPLPDLSFDAYLIHRYTHAAGDDCPFTRPAVLPPPWPLLGELGGQ